MNGITKLLVARIIEGYGDIGKGAPPRLVGGVVYFNTMVDNLRDSKLIVESSSFAAWRARAGSTSASSSKRPASAAEPASRSRPRRDSAFKPVYSDAEESGDESGGESGGESELGDPCSPPGAGEVEQLAIDIDEDDD